MLQPRDGFRAGLNAVMLAAAIPARTTQVFLSSEPKSGTGDTLCAARRVPDCSITAIEGDADTASLSKKMFHAMRWRNAPAIVEGDALAVDLTRRLSPCLRQPAISYRRWTDISA